MPAIMRSATAKVTAAFAPNDAGDATDPPGTFVALVSVFGNEDLDGDIVEAGAFTTTLGKWAATERRLAVMWSHQFNDVDSILGHYSTADETPEGLQLKGHLDLDHPRAARIYALMQEGLITEFSWSGEVLRYEFIEPDDPNDEWAWLMAGIKILEVDLWEAGPCFKGANPETQLISVKAADMTGRMGDRLRQQGKSNDAPMRQAAIPASDPETDPAASATTDQAALAAEDADNPADVEPTIVQRESAAAKARALLGLTITQ